MDESKRKQGGWIMSAMEDGKIYEEDSLEVIKCISISKMNLLNNLGFTKVSVFNLKLQSEEECRNLVSNVKVLGLKSLMKFKNQAEKSILGNCPCDIDHTMAGNPFESRYGENWEKKSPELKTTVSIHILIDHIFREAEEIMKGTVHEKDFLVYHNALSLMTGKGSVEYMQKQWYWDRLIRSLNGVNNKLKRFKNRVAGNHP